MARAFMVTSDGSAPDFQVAYRDSDGSRLLLEYRIDPRVPPPYSSGFTRLFTCLFT